MDLTIKGWHLDEQEPRHVLKAHTAMVNALLFSADGKTLFSSGGEPTIRIWDTELWEVRCVLTGLQTTANVIELLDQRTLVSGGGHIRLWRAATDEEIRLH